MTCPHLSVAVPCCNEEPCLAELYRRVSAACAAAGRSYEIVLVNDGSTDRTWPVMTELADRDSHLVCVNLSRNHGHQLALSAGLSVCTGERVLMMDADLQAPPELLGEMLRVMDGGADVVYARRRSRSGDSAFKRATASLFYRLIGSLTGGRIPRDAGDFRLVTRRVLLLLLKMPERHRFLRGMVAWTGFRQEPVEYDRDPRFAGLTKYPLAKMFRFAVDAVTGFSTKPLALAGWVGAAALAGGVGLLLWGIITSIFCRATAVWAYLVGLFLLVSGCQFVLLGIIGCYLGRLHEQSQGRPLFIIESVYRAKATE